MSAWLSPKSLCGSSAGKTPTPGSSVEVIQLAVLKKAGVARYATALGGTYG